MINYGLLPEKFNNYLNCKYNNLTKLVLTKVFNSELKTERLSHIFEKFILITSEVIFEKFIYVLIKKTT